MSDFDKHSRLNKFEKRRKNTKSISILLIIGSILIILLLGIWIFGGGDDQDETTEQPDEESSDIEINDDTETDTNEDNSAQEDDTSDESSEETNDDQESDEESNNENNNENVEIEEVEPSDDNVSEAYTGNWEPVGTEQEGPHTTTYEEGSQDRNEMIQAVSLATGLNENNMIQWWYENGGDQKVIATVSDNAQTETYRVYLSWIDNEGWQPTKVEKLIENDRKNQ